MNYIAHLSGFFQRVSRDHRFNPTHVSLYMALFQQWNLGRFRNPISVARSEVMEISRISSRVTYHKCIKELHAWGYLHYDPSYNHFRGSLVYMLPFEPRAPDPASTCTGAVPEVVGSCAGAEREVGPSINRENTTNFKNLLNKREAPPFEAGSEKEQEKACETKRKEKGGAQKEKKRTGQGPPELEAVRAFFKAEAWPEVEAFRFFHHYSATGWQLGRTPMRDWQAAARKWSINGINLEQEANEKNPGNHPPVPAAGGEPGATDYTGPL